MIKIFTTFLFMGLLSITYSQNDIKPQYLNHQIGISMGTSNYLGDLANKGTAPIVGEINAKAFRTAMNFNYRYNFTYYTSLKAELMYIRLYGNDANTDYDVFRLNRNLHFRSDIVDLNVMVEWNIMKYEIGSNKRNFTPYIGLGVAGFYFNPQAQLDGKWLNLAEYGTEGQGIIPDKEKYSQFQFALPFSLGVKYNINSFLAIGFDFQYRFTFTDYIDDVSSNYYVDKATFDNNYSKEKADIVNRLAYRAIDPEFSPRATDVRGDPNNNDHYFLMVLNLSYKLSNDNRFFPKVR